MLGSLVGSRLTGLVPPDTLRKGFGWFVIVMGLFVLVQQVPGELAAQPWFWALVGGVLVVGLGSALLWWRRRPPPPVADEHSDGANVVVEQSSSDEELLDLDRDGHHQR